MGREILKKFYNGYYLGVFHYKPKEIVGLVVETTWIIQVGRVSNLDDVKKGVLIFIEELYRAWAFSPVAQLAQGRTGLCSCGPVQLKMPRGIC